MVSDAQTILKMIESVDPKDTDTLDEIDCRFDAFLRLVDFIGHDYGCYYKSNIREKRICLRQYTRSRNALKAVRDAELEGWWFNISIEHTGRASCEAVLIVPITEEYSIPKKLLPTECLAEAHAIVQGIEWKRSTHTPAPRHID